ncbi:MAG: hypothetical protein KF704_08550 [Crocinitomicaceae bacterium]|nr:hypothetical protein [Crocinitomicaceae bacterium]
MLRFLMLSIGLIFFSPLFSQEEESLKSVYFPEYPAREDVSDFAEEEAEFPGGATEMIRYSSKNLKFTGDTLTLVSECILNKINIRFIVEQDGSVTAIQFKNYNSNCPEFYEEVTKILSSMPKWNPALSKGMKVTTYFYLPIHIKWN